MFITFARRAFALGVIICCYISATHAKKAWKLYGFVKASATYADNPINTFNNINLVAPTSATNQNLYSSNNDRSDLQIEQSRLGLKGSLSSKVTTLIEGDFIDFSKSSPTTQTRPRLRRLFLDLELSSKTKIRAGQDWDNFSPLRPKTYDIIGLYFNGGNTGFMRKALSLSHDFSENFNSTLSIGQANKNTALGNNSLEEDHFLSYSSSFTYQLEKLLLTTSLIYANDPSYNKADYGLSFGMKFKKNLTLEMYYGKGLSNLNVLDLPTGSYSESYGGYLTYTKDLTPKIGITLGQGFAYQGSNTVSSLNSDKSFSNLGLDTNWISRVSGFYKIEEIQLYSEVSHFYSDYGNTTSQANTIETGLLTYF